MRSPNSAREKRPWTLRQTLTTSWCCWCSISAACWNRSVVVLAVTHGHREVHGSLQTLYDCANGRAFKRAVVHCKQPSTLEWTRHAAARHRIFDETSEACRYCTPCMYGAWNDDGCSFTRSRRLLVCSVNCEQTIERSGFSGSGTNGEFVYDSLSAPMQTFAWK